MRRISKVKPKEISLCAEGANRRIIAMYKSAKLAKGGPGSGPQKGGGNAKKASKDAEDMSRGVRKGHAEDHDSAAGAHHEAAKTNSEAGQKGKAKEHEEKAEEHENHAKGIRERGESLMGRLVEAAVNSANVKKSKTKGPAELSLKHRGTKVDIADAISNTDPAIYSQLTALAKSVDQANGRGYTPQAASIIKAVGRLLAPFSEELTLSDLQAVGKAAGLGVTAGGGKDEDASPALKKAIPAPNAKNDEEVEDEDGDEDDVAADDGEEDEYEDEDEDEDEEDDEEDAKKSAGPNVALNREKAETLAKAAKSDSGDEEDEDDEDEEDEDEGPAGNLPAAFGRPKGAKAKGEKVGKSAFRGIEELKKSHQALAERNQMLEEQMAKSRKDLDEERDYRQMEGIKKSIREDYPALALEADKYAPMLKSAREAEDQSTYTALTELLKKCNLQVASSQGSLLKSVGYNSAQSSAVAGSWSQKIEAAVDDEMKKSAKREPRAVVYDRFITSGAGRDMYAKHREEQRG